MLESFLIINNQSAGINSIRFNSSETKRQTNNNINNIYNDTYIFKCYLAGALDGDGNFDIRDLNSRLVLKAIRLKMHNRDISVLNHIKDNLNIGRVISVPNTEYSMYIASTQWEMSIIVNLINGMMRLKVSSFKLAYEFLGISFVEADYRLKPFDPYFAGLVDTDGSIVFNYNSNRIECAIEVKNNEYSIKLCLDDFISGQAPYRLIRPKRSSQSASKINYSALWRYQNVGAMIPLYNYFSEFRLYSYFKYHRIMLINKFMSIRRYHNYPRHTHEFKLYAKFVLKFIKYLNPNGADTPFVRKHNLIEFDN